MYSSRASEEDQAAEQTQSLATYRPNSQPKNQKFDWENAEPRTHDYPGSPGGITITKITIISTGRELDPAQIPDQLYQHFEQIAMDYLEEKDNRVLGSYEDTLDARREEEIIRHHKGW